MSIFIYNSFLDKKSVKFENFDKNLLNLTNLTKNLSNLTNLTKNLSNLTFDKKKNSSPGVPYLIAMGYPICQTTINIWSNKNKQII